MSIRENVEKILTLHHDKEPSLQARMVIAYLVRDDVINEGNGQLEDDALYAPPHDEEEDIIDEESSVLDDDYEAIGVSLCRR